VPAAPAPGKDTTRPTAKLDARRDSIRDGRVAVWVTASEAATVTAKGSLSVASQSSTHRLRTATAKVVASKRERMLLRLSKKARRVARRAVRRGKRLRPYPRLIAGTPESFGFDYATDTFELSYSTTAPGPKRVPRGTKTEVFVPSRQYPRGYEVHADGARVVGSSDPAIVRLLAEEGVKRVTVRIVPAG